MSGKLKVHKSTVRVLSDAESSSVAGGMMMNEHQITYMCPGDASLGPCYTTRCGGGGGGGGPSFTTDCATSGCGPGDSTVCSPGPV